MTAVAPDGPRQDEEPYAGPPPMLRPPPDAAPAVPEADDADSAAGPGPETPTPYLLAMRDPSWSWWRPLAGLLLIAFLLGIAVVLARIADLLTGAEVDLDGVPLTWPELLVTDLLIAVALPAVVLAWPVAHGVGPGRAVSSAGRVRPMLRLFLLALLTAGVGVALGTAGAVLLAGRDVDGPVADTVWVLVVGLLTVPLRAAAEEVFFRGYLSQAVVGWLNRPRAGAAVAAVVSALLSAALHGTDDLGGFLGWALFGLAASAAVASTGGLEAAVALHVVCALVVLLLGIVLGEDAVPALVPAGPGAAFALVGAAGLAAYAGLLARRGAPVRGGCASPDRGRVSSSAAP